MSLFASSSVAVSYFFKSIYYRLIFLLYSWSSNKCNKILCRNTLFVQMDRFFF